MTIDQTANIANKRFVAESLAAVADAAPDGLSDALARAYAPNARWRGSHPLNERHGLDAIGEVWAGLKRAVPDVERRDLLVVGGAYEGTQMVACMGHHVGRWERSWLGMPASGGVLALRYGEVHAIRDGRIVLSSCLWDLLDAMRQCGPLAGNAGPGFWPLAPSRGTEMQWMAPITGDGTSIVAREPEEGAASLRQTLAMHKALAEFGEGGGDEAVTREALLAMPQRDHWHPRMMWYGPAGIGTGRGLAGFVDAHQRPFRLAFPNRQGGAQLTDREAGGSDGGGHYVRLGDGPYSVTGGWPSVRAEHRGGALFGTGPTDRAVEMRVMDFYGHHEGLIRENWVPIDVPHLLLQMGVDVFERLETQFGEGRLGLAGD